MTLERILKGVGIDEAIRLMERFKWKFFEAVQEKIRIEIPHERLGTLVVELENTSENQAKLLKEGFLEQEIRWRT